MLIMSHLSHFAGARLCTAQQCHLSRWALGTWSKPTTLERRAATLSRIVTVFLAVGLQRTYPLNCLSTTTTQRGVVFAGTVCLSLLPSSMTRDVTCTKRSAQPNIIDHQLSILSGCPSRRPCQTLLTIDVMIATEDASRSRHETRY